MKKNRFNLFILLLAASFFIGCSSDDNGVETMDPPTPEGGGGEEMPPPETEATRFIINGIIDGAPTDANTVVVSDLTQGSVNVSTAQEGVFEGAFIAEINERLFSTLQTDFGFVEYRVDENGSVSEVARVVAQASNGNIVDLGNDQVLTFNAAYNPDGLVDYTIVDISTMTEVTTGQIAVPINDDALLWPNSIIPKDGKLLLNYIHADINSFANFDGIFTAVLNASTLEVEEIIEDARSATPGYNLSQDHFFDSNGDLYIGTTNSNYWGINENLPAGILRIRSGELEYDETYFFDVTSQINNEYFAGLAQLTDTKALIKVFRSDLIEQFADYSQKAVIEHWVVDVQTQTAEKLDIPLSLAPFADPVVLDDGNFGIVANTSEGSFIYIYDESTGSVQQGLEYEGIDFIRTITAIP
mgnify:FL=1